MKVSTQVIQVTERPRAWLSDLDPKISNTHDGGLILKGDPVLSRPQWFVIWVLIAMMAFGAPWLGGFAVATADDRIAFAIWCLFCLSGPLIFLALFPSILKVDGKSRKLIIRSGLWKPRTLTVSFDHILEIRHQKVFYMTIGGRMPAQRIETDLAYLEMKKDAPSIHSQGPLWGAPILSVNASCMDQFLEFCERHQITINKSAAIDLNS